MKLKYILNAILFVLALSFLFVCMFKTTGLSLKCVQFAVSISCIGAWVIILVFLLDVAVLYEIVRSKCTEGYKIFYALIVLLLPIIGVSIYYLIRK